MKTKIIKVEAKYLIVSSLVLSIPIFLFFLLSKYLVIILNASYAYTIIIFYLCSIVLAFFIAAGFSIFSSTVSDAMFTLRRMLRLDSLSNPLLLKLSVEAPGTYHHSLNVSNLAQRACKSIGGNSLLVRTAAYYHDLGKLSNPKLYIENQSESEIPSEENAQVIRLQANKIIDHVKEGVKIARDNHLPEDVVDLIAEHHGTTKAIYFYEKAKERNLKIKKTDFCYPGPTPQSKESAILMLADCVEATSRAYPILTKELITEIVENSVEERLDEKQFKSSTLTDMEITEIKRSLIETLLSVYHQRISYKNKDEAISKEAT